MVVSTNGKVVVENITFEGNRLRGGDTLEPGFLVENIFIENEDISSVKRITLSSVDASVDVEGV